MKSMTGSLRSIIENIKSRTVRLEEAGNELINNIASRTNLLSMNAAIEAGHAGEAGKASAS